MVVPFLGVLGGTPDTYHHATSLQQDRGQHREQDASRVDPGVESIHLCGQFIAQLGPVRSLRRSTSCRVPAGSTTQVFDEPPAIGRRVYPRRALSAR